MKLFRAIARWAGLATLLFGVGTIAWGLAVIVQYETGWGLTLIDRQLGSDWAKAALGLLLSGMFFVLVGGGMVLVSRYEGRDEAHSEGAPRWAKPVTFVLYASGFGAIGLATLFAGMTDEFGDATPGIVSYCMLMGVGLLFSGWGLKRAGDRPSHPGSP